MAEHSAVHRGVSPRQGATRGEAKGTGAVCFIGLGANIGKPQQQLRSAVAALATHAALSLRGCSSLYASAPLGPAEQPEFLNAVCELHCSLPPLDLLDLLQTLESAAGRVRAQHWGPRLLDLDLLLYGNLRLDSPRLQVPHPGLDQRSFVLYPLVELCGEGFTLPDGSTLASCMRRTPGPAIRKLGPLIQGGRDAQVATVHGNASSPAQAVDASPAQ